MCSLETRSSGTVLFPVLHPGEHAVMWDSLLIHILYENINKREQFSPPFLIDSTDRVLQLTPAGCRKFFFSRNLPVMCVFFFFLLSLLAFLFVYLFISGLTPAHHELLSSNLGFRPHS